MTATTMTAVLPTITAPATLEQHPLYLAADAEQRAALTEDRDAFRCDVKPEHLAEVDAEYLDALTEWASDTDLSVQDRLATYLAECGYSTTDAIAADLASALDRMSDVVPAIHLPPATVAAEAEAAAVVQVVQEDAAGGIPASVVKAGVKAGELVYGADCNVMAKRCKAGKVCHDELAKQRGKASTVDVWGKKRASYSLAMEAAVEEESGVKCSLPALIGTYHVSRVLAELADMDADTWSKGVSFAVGRECIPLVQRNPETEEWAMLAGITAELAALAKQLASGRLAAAWTVAKVRELVALHLTRKAEQAKALAATLGTSPADMAQKVRLENEALAAEKAAARKLAPKAKAATVDAPVVAPVAPTAGEKSMADFEATLENMAYGNGKGGDPASAVCRAAHAWTLMGDGISGLEAFADILARESNDTDTETDPVDVLLTRLCRTMGSRVAAIVRRELKAAELAATK